MSRTDKDQRCYCPRPAPSICPHCGCHGNAADFSRCHREWLGVGSAARSQRRWQFLMREWRGNLRDKRHGVKRRLRRLERRRLKNPRSG